ncbi:hypothetical protein AVEN_59270-1 [Araneus ventricosus]|uniref:Uncharacterized protein n=1 Tax=Araneus ventricosus TaxID=182803 RepID=A0A4Y2G2S0_ARAVE|nr:hypothetical protein AVEN_59270-1 [Araneus ventricosus]
MIYLGASVVTPRFMLKANNDAIINLGQIKRTAAETSTTSSSIRTTPGGRRMTHDVHQTQIHDGYSEDSGFKSGTLLPGSGILLDLSLQNSGRDRLLQSLAANPPVEDIKSIV